ncbi:hypothetical protein SLEP1_g414 [Rubroshorea leprosula]|uniref:Retrotransposon gag domain-containing protein n=1 Tax=Rubroshorea leprosula TaxID=152421 RepID=A0AAV5HAB7_9ROSI|nr:hypothetical protein SLEP1_g414 [Rubroshorea leprosula]
MPRRVGKEVAQQVEIAPMSPIHSQGENSLEHLPPISPLADRSYGNPIYRKDDEENVDFAESSNKIFQELQQIRRLQEEANQNIKRSLESLLQAQQQQTFTAVSERTMEHVRQQQNVPRQPGPPAMELPQQNLPDPLPGGHINQPQVVQQMPNAQNNALGAGQPYPDYIDRDNPFPRGFKVPEFTLFSGDASQSTIEHIGRFTIQCREASGDDFLKLRLFPSSLTEPEISMADLSRLTQRPGESSENYLMRFRKARMKCHVALPEQEFVKLAQNGLDIELQKKFEGMEFRDFFELSYKVARYENLLREESQRKAASQGTYYQDAFDLDVAEVFANKPVTCPNLVKVTQQVEVAAKRLPYESRRQYTFDVTKDKIDKGLLHFPEKPKEAMGVDENPFWNVDVGVNVADISSVSRRTYKRMVWKRKENQEVAVQNESQLKVPPPKLTSLIVNENELKATFEADQQTELTSDDNLLQDMDVLQISDISINLSCLVLTLPLVFQAKGSKTTHVPTHVSNGSMFVEEEMIEVPAQEEEEEHDILSEQIIFNKPDENVARHIKPLYILAHMDGVPVNRVLVDNEAAVNVIPSFMLSNLARRQ